MNTEKKKDNVIGIGHNQNEYSKEQYAKLMNATYKILSYAKDMVSNVEHKFDEAFTKHENAVSWERKLKDFEIHERRIKAKSMSKKCWNNLNEHIEALEEKAKINGIDIEGSDER